MAIRYLVKQGDYLTKIAHEHGFSDFLTLWDDPANAELRQKRKSPNVLFPGDVVAIPDSEPKRETGSTEQRHRFVAKGKPLKLRLEVEDAFRDPLRNAPCELEVEGERKDVKRSDAQGRLEVGIPPNTQRGRLVFREVDTVFKDFVLDIQIGSMDPVVEIAGQSKRLVNLGYLKKLAADRDDPEFLSALQEFQIDHDLVVDGRCGRVTQAQLEKVHGS